MKDKFEEALVKELRRKLLDLDYMEMENILLKRKVKTIISSLASNYREIFLDELGKYRIKREN